MPATAPLRHLKECRRRKCNTGEIPHATLRNSICIFEEKVLAKNTQYDSNGWYDQLGGDDSPLSEAILDRIKHDAYKINIIPTDPANYRSMREVYGLDPALSE